MECQYCQGLCQKAGKQGNGVQKYFCKLCKKYQQSVYQYKACHIDSKQQFLKCLHVGNSLSGIRVILGIALSTQVRWIRSWSKRVEASKEFKSNDIYEIDELCTYVQNKNQRRWVVSAISRSTGRIIDIQVGHRNKKLLSLVVDKVLKLSPKAIYTDKLNSYRSLIPQGIHQVKQRGINKIERFHLSLRTHVKRLNRRTICFSKQINILKGILRLYIVLRDSKCENKLYLHSCVKMIMKD